jgi:hypothetical protein
LILIVEIAVFSYLDAVLPKQFGVSKKPWFFLTPIIKLFRRSTGSSAVGRYVTRPFFTIALRSNARIFLPPDEVSHSLEAGQKRSS